MCAFLALTVAASGTRHGVGCAALWLLTALYVGVYAASQIDSYQHHYLACLVLLLLVSATVRGAGAANRRAAEAQTLLLLTRQVAFVYLWTTVTKLHGDFLGGVALRVAAGGVVAAHVVPALAAALRTTDAALYALLAVGTVVVEAALSAALLVRRCWPLAAALGVALHVSFELSGFLIAQFGRCAAGRPRARALRS